jgi:carbohydrate-binding DOMON domain-containing protein
MIGHDGYGPGRVRPITKNPGEWTFGGSTDALLEPRIIDMLVPSNITQGSVLGAFKVSGKLDELPGIPLVKEEL